MDVKTNNTDIEKMHTLSERFGLSALEATILSRRGVKTEEMKYYLENEFVYRESPFVCEDIYNAVDRINDAIDEDETIMIMGDRDVDGVTATATLYRTLKKLGAKNVIARLPQGDEVYGLSDKIVTQAINEGVTLLITVDNGITALEEVKKLETEGISVIITDHHLPLLELPPATAIINPKVEGSGFSFDSYCGCTVASKLSWALLFSRTDLYGSQVILLHSEPGHDTIKTSAVVLENLVEIDRINVEILLNGHSYEIERLISFLDRGLPIVVLDQKSEKSMLNMAFGSGVDISLEDFRPLLEKRMPSSRGKTLFELANMSRAALYKQSDKELETLISLFRSVSIFSHPSLCREFETIMQFEAIGTIGDSMPLKGENRLIVKKGLKLLETKPAPCFFDLLNRQNMLGRPINAREVAFKITPVLNAAGRMGHPEEALDLLLSDSYEDGEKYTEILLKRNRERQLLEEDTLTLVKDKAEDSLNEMGGKFIFIEDGRIPRGLTGSISSKLLSSYLVPALVISVMDERSSGSLRAPDSFNAKEFLSNFSYLFDDYGGHAAAAGFSLDTRSVDTLKNEIKTYLENEKTDEESKEDIITVDAIIPESHMKPDLWTLNNIFEPYGNQSPALALYVRGAVIEEVYSLSPNSSEKHLRGTVRYGSYAWPFVWWSCPERAPFSKGKKVKFVFSPEINYWKGHEKDQINISQMWPDD